MATLFHTFLAFKKDIVYGLSAEGLKFSQPKILYHIYTHPGCQQKDVAESCYLETATLSSVLRNLEERQLIKREQDEKDKRAYKIYTTEESKKYIEIINNQLNKTVDKAFDGFTKKEVDQVYAYLDRIYNNLNKANQE